MKKYTYTEEQINAVFDLKLKENAIHKFINEMNDKSSEENDSDNDLNKNDIDETKTDAIDDESTEKEETNKIVNEINIDLTSKVKSLINDIDKLEPEEGFITLTELDIKRKFKTNDYISLIFLIADKKLKVMKFKDFRAGKNIKIPNDEIIITKY